MSIFKTILIISSVLFIAGCSTKNNFEESYRGMTEYAELSEYCYNSSPNIVNVNKITEKEIFEFMQKGYIPIGHELFYLTGTEKLENLNTFAKKIGACSVLISERILETSQNFEYAVVYFTKSKKNSLGIFVKDFTDDLKKQHSRNNGVYVVCIVDNSLAYHANIIVGDIINSVNGHMINNSSEFKKINLNNGINEFEIIRDGKKIIKKINYSNN